MGMPLKPQDLLVCLELATREQEPWTYAELAADLGISPSETNKAVERALEAGLLSPPSIPRGKPGPIRASLLNFLIHGVRHAFFASPGRLVRGMPTAHSAAPLNAKLRGGDEPPLVWPDSGGASRGQSVEPLYPTVPGAAKRNPALYELLALTDSLRCGRARERKLAAKELEARLKG
ncbi:MAG: hypothetical protein ACI8X5_003235 [Planctomycetota bacterium]|jgi:hypothetical protein